MNTQSFQIDARQPIHAQPRTIGAARLSVRQRSDGETQIATLRQSGASKLVFPRTFRTGIEAVFVNTAGGITGGDQFDLEIGVRTDAKLTLTTQAAERAYRSQPDETAHVTTKLKVDDGGSLNWLPQELILFNRCIMRRRLDVDLQGTARFLMVEPVVFGRTAMFETLNDARFQDRISITRDNRPLYIDGMDMDGDIATHLSRASIANGANAMASVVVAAPNARSYLKAVRSMLPDTAGASALNDDLLVVRFLAFDGFDLRRSLVPVLEHLSQSTLPTSWRL